MENSFEVPRLAGAAMAQAMYPYTFGIVTDYDGMEGRGLGTGVGVVWRGTFLIATARHVIADTTPQRVYYLLPQQNLQIPESSASSDWSQVKYGLRCVLETPRILYGDPDLAAILVPQQTEPTAAHHFYGLEGNEGTPLAGANVGYFGYPAAAAKPVGRNYAAMPSYGFGKICLPKCQYDPDTEFAVEYAPRDELDPHGFSGSGVWHSLSSGKVWSPRISLAGLITSYYRASQILCCCRVERLISFLSADL
jgi:hypothetical protein